MQHKKECKQGFSLAEAMITLLIVSLILAAVVPVVSKRQATSDKIWNYTYTTAGNPTANIYWGIKDGQTAVIGGHSVPDSALGARLSLVTAADNAALTDQVLRYAIRRPLLSFFQRAGTTMVPLGKISFDQWGNSAIGSNSMYSTVPTSIDATTRTLANEAGLDAGSADRGSLNTTLGFNGLYLNTTGSRNTSLGANSLASNTTGYGNIAIGAYAGYKIADGMANTAVGTASLLNNISGEENTAIGNQALKYNAGSYPSDTGSFNVAVGSYSLWKNNTGSNNVAVGANSMAYAINNGTANSNYWNTAVGVLSLYKNTGQANVAVGISALQENLAGTSNTAIGTHAMHSNNSGVCNTAVGRDSLYSTLGGNYNIAIGYQAGYDSTLSEMLYIEGRGDQNVSANSLIVGSFAAANRYVKINGTLYNQAGGVIAASDKRLKKDIKEENTGLEEILKLQIKSYKYSDDKKQRPHIGVIAQELKEIMPDAVVAGPGNDKLKEILYVDQNYILFKLVNAVKQLYTKTISNLNRIIVLEKEVKDLKSQNKHLKKELASVEERLTKLERQHPQK